MMFKEMLGLMLVGTAVALSLSASAERGFLQTPAPNADAQAMADFSARVDAYAAQQKKVASSLPKLPEKATPEQVYAHEIAIEKLMVASRAGAKKGDVFGPAFPAVCRKLLAPVFKGAAGANTKQAIQDEAQPVAPVINKRYPDDAPLSTMPPDVLKVLPKLPDTLEYRFISRHLILFDVPAHMIADIVDNAIPQ